MRRTRLRLEDLTPVMVLGSRTYQGRDGRTLGGSRSAQDRQWTLAYEQVTLLRQLWAVPTHTRGTPTWWR